MELKLKIEVPTKLDSFKIFDVEQGRKFSCLNVTHHNIATFLSQENGDEENSFVMQDVKDGLM